MATIRSIAEIRRELADQEKKLTKLKAQRKRIVKQLAGIDSEIAALGGKPANAKRRGRKEVAKKITAKKVKRTRGGPSLADVLAQALEGKGQVKVAEAAKLAVQAGYKSKSSQFGNIVSQTLSGDKRFKKIARGVYALEAAKQAAPKKKVGKTAKKAAARKKIAKKPGGLKGMLVQVMAGRKSVGVREAMEAVLAAGYKTKAKDFRFIVNQTLIRGDEFKQVGRGKYALKG